MAHLLDKDFKATVLKMLKELKQDAEKVNKMMYEHNGSVGKRVTKSKEKQKKITELKSTITGILKFTRSQTKI